MYLGQVTFAARMVRDFNETKTPSRTVRESADVYTPTMVPAGSTTSRILAAAASQIAARNASAVTPPKPIPAPVPQVPIKAVTGTSPAPEMSTPLTYSPRPVTTVKAPTTRAASPAPSGGAVGSGSGSGSGVTVTGGESEKSAQDSGSVWPIILGALAAATFF